MNDVWIVSQRILLACFLVAAGSVSAADIKVLCANGMQTVLETLAPAFERTSGHKLEILYATGGAAAKRAEEGEKVDVLIAPSNGIDSVKAAGKIGTGGVAAIASTGISVAVRKGAAKPDLSTPEAFKRALLAAKSITYLDPKDGGASGIHFAKVLDQLGIAGEMKNKTLLAAKADALGAMVAKGEAEIGILQYQLLFAVEGIEIAGPLPDSLQSTTIFFAAIMGAAKDTRAAEAFITFLRSVEAAAAIRKKGMEPAGNLKE